MRLSTRMRLASSMKRSRCENRVWSMQRKNSTRCSSGSSRCSAESRTASLSRCGPIGRSSGSNSGASASTAKRMPSENSAWLDRTSARFAASTRASDSSRSEASTSDSSLRRLRTGRAAVVRRRGSHRLARADSYCAIRAGLRSARTRRTSRSDSKQCCCSSLLRACSARRNSCCSSASSASTMACSRKGESRDSKVSRIARTRPGKARDLRVRSGSRLWFDRARPVPGTSMSPASESGRACKDPGEL